jgi:hypothetical protein
MIVGLPDDAMVTLEFDRGTGGKSQQSAFDAASPALIGSSS